MPSPWFQLVLLPSQLVLPLSPLLLLAGCDAECEGARCADLYDATDLNLILGTSLVESAVSPLSPDGSVHGTPAEGTAWSLLGADASFVAGVPDLSELRLYDASAFLDGTGPTGRLSGDTATERFGASLAALGDAVLVGAPRHDASEYDIAVGAVYQFDGPPASGAGALRVVRGEHAQDQLGTVVAGCGDLDADGEPDWAAAAPWAESDPERPLAGSVYVALTTSELPVGVVSPDLLLKLEGALADARFGAAIACSASLDGDTLAELVVGSPFAEGADDRPGSGIVQLWRGAGGFGGGAALRKLVGPEAEGWFGSAVATGDMDGDGAPELIIGAPGVNFESAANEQDTAGAVYVFRGSDISSSLNLPDFLGEAPEPIVTLRGVDGRGRFGSSLLLADMDGDGLDDLLVGAPGLNPTGVESAVQAGAAYLFLGDPGAWGNLRYATTADTTIGDDRQYLRTGERLAVSDLDGDGRLDLLVLNRADTQ